MFTTIKSVSLSSYLINIYVSKGESKSGLYKHSSSLTNSAGDNSYRFAGSDPDNYVCFGYDSIDGTCPTDNLYRIIGRVNLYVKLIKYDYAKSSLLGTDGEYRDTYANLKGSGTAKGVNQKSEIAAYMWNYNDGSGSNIWDTSLLNKTNLNTNFLNNIGSKWTNMIETVIWKVGGGTSDDIQNVVPLTAYQNEVVNCSNSYVSKVGLAYASDYGFAAKSSAWSETLWDYNSTSITTNNWMYMGLDEWTITPRTVDDSKIFSIHNYGHLDYSSSTSGLAVRPAFYLKDSVNYISGDGTKDLPFIISD